MFYLGLFVTIFVISFIINWKHPSPPDKDRKPTIRIDIG